MPLCAPPTVFELLQDLSQSMQSTSCVSQQPFSKLEDGGVAPTLSYQMPQKAAFTTYGAFVPLVSSEVFETAATEIPDNNFYKVIANAEPETVKKLLTDALVTQKNTARLLPPAVTAPAANHVQHAEVERSESAPNRLKVATSNANNAPNTPREPIICGLPLGEIVDTVVRESKMPLFSDGLGGTNPRVDFVPEPAAPNPMFFVIEEYTTASFLGSYGAGKVVKTMELLPGERRKYEVKTFRETTSSTSKAENVLEGFTDNSTREMESSMERENSTLLHWAIASITL